MSAPTEARARRKGELLLLARIERIELSLHMREFQRLKRPAGFAVIGARIFQAWRSPAWATTVAALLAARGLAGGRMFRALRYAGYAFAAWRTYRLFQQYVAVPARAAAAASDDGRNIDRNATA